MGIALEEFLENTEFHKVVSKITFENEDLELRMELVRCTNIEGSEFLKLCFDDAPKYLTCEKIFVNPVKNEMMVIAPPFLYTHDPNTGKGNFIISKSYKVYCDVCGNETNYITTTGDRFFCDDCWETCSDDNTIIVFAGMLTGVDDDNSVSESDRDRDDDNSEIENIL